MADYRKNEIISGLFIVLAAAVFALFAFRVGDADLFGLVRGEPLVCETRLTDVKSLKPGAAVKVGGRAVGEVTSLRVAAHPLTREQARHLSVLYGEPGESRFEEGRVRQLIEVLFELDDPDLDPDPRTARVFLRQDSLLAPHFLELDPGVRAKEGVPSSREEGVGTRTEPLFLPSREGGGFQEMMASLAASLVELDEVLTKVNRDVLSDENTSRIGRVLESLDRAVDEVHGVARRMGSLLDPRDDPRLGNILDELARGTQGLGDRLDGIQTDLQELLRGTRSDVESLLGGARGIIDENRGGVAETVRRLRRAMWQAELALRKIRTNPSVLLFGDDEQDLEAVPMDETLLRRAGRAGPYEQRDERTIRRK